MRIIGGEAKGRRLKAPDTAGTRPATDRVREAVFSTIGSWVVDAAVADLYAGSGSFGLEALSRGASSVVFVESGRKALAALEANVEAVGLGGTIVAGTVEDFIEASRESFHLVFMDPPWDQPAEEMSRVLAELDKLVVPDGEIVVSRRHGDDLPHVPKTWRVATDKRYGDTRILRYEKTDDQVPPQR
ncbi:MAG: 16S rRNA (guanine(966)-N(2))-methyltransferase RsmD [Acidimicrobiia bacterium]|nr:16S rRNA (guanine(966)-N(2))-methyltransferase RsmD [Acidimicrobiia bacterium]